MDASIRKALTWTLFGLGILMIGFTALDIGSGVASTALWIGLFAWLIVVGASLYALLSDRKTSQDPVEESKD